MMLLVDYEYNTESSFTPVPQYTNEEKCAEKFKLNEAFIKSSLQDHSIGTNRITALAPISTFFYHGTHIDFICSTTST
jgi:hypothetical protein